MCVVCLNNGRIIADGKYFVRSYWGKINAQSENLHSILNHKQNATFSYMFSLMALLLEKAVKEASQRLYKSS